MMAAIITVFNVPSVANLRSIDCLRDLQFFESQSGFEILLGSCVVIVRK